MLITQNRRHFLAGLSPVRSRGSWLALKERRSEPRAARDDHRSLSPMSPGICIAPAICRRGAARVPKVSPTSGYVDSTARPMRRTG